jgi:hypothetical protein
MIAPSVITPTSANKLNKAKHKFTKQGEVALRVRKAADGRDWVELAVANTASA